MRRFDFLIEQQDYEILRKEAFRKKQSIGAVIRAYLKSGQAQLHKHDCVMPPDKAQNLNL